MKGKGKNNRVVIFDTTLRDGEQSPGATMNTQEKLRVAHQLARLGVDVIEAGFPASSKGDFEAVSKIAREIGQMEDGPVICGLARTSPQDIKTCAEAIAPAKRRRVHTFIATSDLHMEKKLNMTREQVLAAAGEAVKLARTFTDDVEFSCEDATRTDLDFMCQVVGVAVDAGATTINIPDTVGYAMPQDYDHRIRYLFANVRGIERCVVSVHCHNDLGLAVANSLVGVMAGARQVECTINGIGERAGNASLEEIVAALKTRPDHFGGLTTGIHLPEIYRSSRLISSITGMAVQPNKAVVGANAFAHEAGIHQDGVIKDRLTYEIMKPEDFGWEGDGIVLGKHSGRRAFTQRLQALGFTNLNPEEINRAFKRFKELCDQKKDVYDGDIYALMVEGSEPVAGYDIADLVVLASLGKPPTVGLTLGLGEHTQEVTISGGDGQHDAVFAAINQIVDLDIKLVSWQAEALSPGKEAQATIRVRLAINGREFNGHGVATDVLVASAKAYLSAINRYKLVANL